MIVPRNRLLKLIATALILWTAAFVLFWILLTAMSATPADFLTYLDLAQWDLAAVSNNLLLTMLALAGIAATIDAMLSLRRLDGLSAALPDVIRFQKDHDGLIEILLANEQARTRRIRLSLALPPTLTSPREDIEVELTGDHARSKLTWPCTPSRRGSFVLENVYAEAVSMFGLWGIRGVLPCRAEIRVYPNLFRERKHVAAVFLNRGGFGIHAQRQVGKGREFERLREYLPGDSYDEIHWKATAKRGVPVTKVFQIERTQEVYLVIDSSRLSGRPVEIEGEKGGTVTVSQLERFLAAASVLGVAAERQGDLFGMVTFSDRVDRFIPARAGKGHYTVCREAVYTIQPSRVTPDFDELFTFLRLKLRRRALLVFLTNLDDPVLAEAFVKGSGMIARQHLALVNMISPHGAAPVFSDARVTSVDDVYDRLRGHIEWNSLRELERVLHRQGVTFALADSERLAAELVTRYINIKRRQLL